MTVLVTLFRYLGDSASELRSSVIYVKGFIQDDQKVSVHLMILL